MKTIGLLGGMSWESSAVYYRIVNQHVRHTLGGQHSAKVILYSVDFAEIEQCQVAGRWDEAARILKQAGMALERAGADLLVLCTNTMHKVADAIASAVEIPLLHIAEATAREILRQHITTVGLLGTQYTMEQDFYRGKLADFGLQVLIPGEDDRRLVHEVIYHELCFGQVKPASREQYKRIMSDLVHRGAQGIILGCTEISLLVNPEDAPVPVFDTTSIHAKQAAALCLASD